MATGLSEQFRKLLEITLDSVPDPMRVVGPDGRALLMNKEARTHFPDGLGHLCGDPAGNGDSSCPACQVKEVFRTRASRRWHVAVPRPGRSESRDFYEVTLGPLNDTNGEMLAVMEILRDVTATLGLEHYLIGEAERQEEEVKRRTDELQKLSKKAGLLRTELGALREKQTEVLFRDRLMALGRLVAGVAHEVHTPLGAVLSSADLLERSMVHVREMIPTDSDDERCRAMASRMEAMESAVGLVLEGSRRIEQVIRTLRLYSRLDEADLTVARLEEGLDSTLELVKYRMGDRIKVIRRYCGLAPILCRPDALNQVFMNILLNAVHAIPGEGEIILETSVEGDDAVVKFGDTGSGIPEENLSRIFDLGFTTRERGVGSGIGLSICKRIIDDHGGTISVATREGGGTDFTVTLPIKREDD